MLFPGKTSLGMRWQPLVQRQSFSFRQPKSALAAQRRHALTRHPNQRTWPAMIPAWMLGIDRSPFLIRTPILAKYLA
jgi:hypothetical protein